ncbi:SMI1/KNR4 family protein [Streptomyces jumonjinensis]|uniref:SMI1/KNR4 family protein n=1 Tax=Streptomyces jumonjinensis TaxID=1945 RepID=A0A646KSF6_STRJU|nr:SMI1/KNR4 family protein [Streptomyces jumonjinensis]MQT05155.1 SMI1/KNR4 family protein [Streptomyces jumonjinensis]
MNDEARAEVPFDWWEFLIRWSGEWADAQDFDGLDGPDEELVASRWLGFPAASDTDLAALEERVGHRLPPSLRAFLQVSNGWRNAGPFVYHLGGSRDVRPHLDGRGLGAVFAEYLDEDASPQDRLRAGMWERALQLEVESDSVLVLIDPLDVDGDGEWAVYEYAHWLAAPPERYPSFRHYMTDRYRDFHRMAADDAANGDAPPFVNDTTRALDEAVEEARLTALGGAYERAEAVLAEACAFGRPRAVRLLEQLAAFACGGFARRAADALAADPVYASDLLPLAAAVHAGEHQGPPWELLARCTTQEARAAAQEALRAAEEGSYRFTAAGPLGRAAEGARDLARWGRWNEAWRVLVAALPHWRPLGPDHLAPMGLLADPVLAPLITPERGRLLLGVPRGSQAGAARETLHVPSSAGDDPVGLSWLADEVPDQVFRSYRVVFVADRDPAGLPARIGHSGRDDNGGGGDGDREGAVSGGLHPPMSRWDAEQRLRQPRWGRTSADRALVAVGQAAPGWSFAFDGDPAPFDEQRFLSPAAAASNGTRAVVIWSSCASPGRYAALFHLSIGAGGEEVCAFSVTGGDAEPQWSGEVPDWLDLDGFPQTPEDWRGGGGRDYPDGRLPGERLALAVLERALGLTLPRSALLHGPLHTFVTRSWTRPPAPGEAALAFGWYHADRPAPGQERA